MFAGTKDVFFNSAASCRDLGRQGGSTRVCRVCVQTRCASLFPGPAQGNIRSERRTGDNCSERERPLSESHR